MCLSSFKLSGGFHLSKIHFAYTFSDLCFLCIDHCYHRPAPPNKILHSFSDAAWYPIFFTNTANNKNLKHFSEYNELFVEILNEIFQNWMNITSQPQTAPWKRAPLNVKKSVADFLLTIPTEARLKYAVKNRLPIFQMYMYIYTYKDHPLLKKIIKYQNCSGYR